MAARREFAARGYAATSVRDIVARAGVTSPVLYHHFGNKAGVYEAVATELNDHVLRAFEQAVAAKTSYVERLEAVIVSSRAIQRDAPDIASFVMTSPQDVARHPELAAVKPQMSRLSTFAETVAGDGLPDGITPRQAARVLLTIVFGLSRMAVVESPRQYAATTDAVIALVRGSLV